MFQPRSGRRRKTTEAAAPPRNVALESFNETGVIVYRPTGSKGKKFSRAIGEFALPMYQGALATEELRKIDGPEDDFHGTYALTTFTAAGSGFPKVAAKGTLTIEPMAHHSHKHGDDSCESAHWVTWDFVPEKWLNEASGYARTGTHLKYVGVAIQIAGVDSPRLVAAWSNNVFSRTWKFKGQQMIQYGVCGSPVPASQV